MKTMITSQVLDYVTACVQYVTKIYSLFLRLPTFDSSIANNKPSLNYFDRKGI